MLRTAESVTPNHPDKLCDRISDAILDACLEQDPLSRVAIETMGGHGIITITGELTTKAFVDVREIAQRIAGKQYGVQNNIVRQSSEIAQGVDTGGAGDQGIMVGYACNETPELMPLEVMLSRSLCQYIYNYCPTDGKTQITLYGKEIQSIVASFQGISRKDLGLLVEGWLKSQSLKVGVLLNIFINPAGDWTIGGFEADTGLTGRKLVVDNYGPRIPLGGGCFSGKDATKVDRSAAYMARNIAVKMLKNMKAKEIFCYLAYAIGKAEPLQATIVVDGVEANIFDLKDHNIKLESITPRGIIKLLDLRKPQFEKTAEWGHFGRGFKWDE